MKTSVRLLHCSYHKCLTVYYKNVLTTLYNRIFRWSRGYHHCYSYRDEFYRTLSNYTVSSLNNHSVNIERLGEFRLSRFIRDPRDLVVSGYWYHKRGAEAWCTLRNPRPEDWMIVNGNIPPRMTENDSFTSYLQRVSEAEGLMAEIDFRKWHLQSMTEWPAEDPRILVIRYEHMLGHERDMFGKLFTFYQVSLFERLVGLALANAFSARKQHAQSRHIRNPAPNQWQQYFTPSVKAYFDAQYAPLITMLGYPSD